MKTIIRHKNCGGFVLPDLEHSFSGMMFYECPKCGATKLTSDDLEESKEDITMSVIMNNHDEYLEISLDDDHKFTITFETAQMAKEFAEKNGIPESEYKIVPAYALYCDKAPVTNGRMIIDKGE